MAQFVGVPGSAVDALFRDSPSSCSRALSTGLTGRSRNSCGYFLGAGITSPFREINASTTPGAIQDTSNWTLKAARSMPHNYRRRDLDIVRWLVSR